MKEQISLKIATKIPPHSISIAAALKVGSGKHIR